MLCQLLVISALLKDYSPHLFSLLLILHSLTDTGLQKTQQLVPPFLLILSGPKQVHKSLGCFRCLD